MYTTIYRVEDPSGTGPYCSSKRYENDDLDNTLHSHNAENGRPGPRLPGEPWEGLISVPDHYFGFLLIEDLYTWFNDAKIILRQCEFRIAKIDLPPEDARKILLGNSGQISFPRLHRGIITYLSL